MPSRSSEAQQASLFELPGREIEAAPAAAEAAELAARLPSRVRLGTMSWSFSGWRGLVYAPDADVKRLPAEGLTAYARHPLLRAVEIDRSYYDPFPSGVFRRFAAQVPAGFRFLVKAHEDCTVRRFPSHARYGDKRGRDNSRYLDAAYATEAVVGPAVEGLGERLGALLFQFSPEELGSAPAFADRLASFLIGLPCGVPYAVELRSRALLGPEYAAALEAGGAVHCHNAWSEMPSPWAQAKRMPPAVRRPLVIRWLLRCGDTYRTASARFAPFDRIVAEDTAQRESIARLVATALRHDVPALVFVNNDAEGCAPESLLRLARCIVERS